MAGMLRIRRKTPKQSINQSIATLKENEFSMAEYGQQGAYFKTWRTLNYPLFGHRNINVTSMKEMTDCLPLIVL